MGLNGGGSVMAQHISYLSTARKNNSFTKQFPYQGWFMPDNRVQFADRFVLSLRLLVIRNQNIELWKCVKVNCY